jgi:hypothetical protein
MEKKGCEFERMAMKLAALNFAFESARAGNSDREFTRVFEKFEEMGAVGVEKESTEDSI